MSPFNLHDTAIAPPLSDVTPEKLKAVYSTFTTPHIQAFVYQWLSEGVPAVFRSNPFLFEDLRSWIGTKVNVHPKCLILVGSARFGFSLGKDGYGRPFSSASDLDFACIEQDFLWAA